jgi:hypothetical protein
MMASVAKQARSIDRHRRVVLARAVTRLMNEWHIKPADQLRLLGLSTRSTNSLSRYRAGNPLPSRAEILNRSGHLLGIYRSLKLLYPKHPEIQKRWFGSANVLLGGHSPLAIASTQGLPGLLMIRDALEAMRN